jgi:putative membrane protein
VLNAPQAHEIGPVGPGFDLHWLTEPISALALSSLAVLYGAGMLRAIKAGVLTRRGEPVLFATGWILLWLALVSPIHSGGETLLSLHMLQHTLLVAGPGALVAGRTSTRVVQGLPLSSRGRLMRRLRMIQPPRAPFWLVVSLFVATVIVWHIPPVFEAAVRSPQIHAFEHATLLLAAWLFWSRVVGPQARYASLGASMASLFGIAVVGAGIGALLTFATNPWYPLVAERTAEAGFDWLADQQLAGVAMTVPMGALIMATAARLGWRWSGAGGWAVVAAGAPPASSAGKDVGREKAEKQGQEIGRAGE